MIRKTDDGDLVHLVNSVLENSRSLIYTIELKPGLVEDSSFPTSIKLKRWRR